ncbi:MAG: glycosyltransferase [Bryobacter sp.]|nr:glycosyltransferase [Bryobacter sp.]
MSKPKLLVLNPLGDYAFNSYGWELCEAVGEQGAKIDFVTCGWREMAAEMPAAKRHEIVDRYGSSLWKPARGGPAGVEKVKREAGAAGPAKGGGTEPKQRRVDWRKHYLAAELLVNFRSRGSEWLWTQWPECSAYANWLRKGAKLLGMRLAHTVHNVLPHEVRPEDREICGEVYRGAELLFVHSEMARRRLLEEFPELDAGKVVMHRMGTYTSYRRREGERAKWRQRWGVGEGEVVWLVCGSIRPYKNVDAVLEAMAGLGEQNTVLVVQGKELGFAGKGDPLAHTKEKAREWGLEERIRWVPGMVSMDEMSELMEAADGLLLPYKEGFGSALLSVGMSFGLHILSTPVGGAPEYLAEYGWGTLIESEGAERIREGMARGGESIRRGGGRRQVAPESLSWQRAGRTIVGAFEQRRG